jgi:hypothetical protein
MQALRPAPTASNKKRASNSGGGCRARKPPLRTLAVGAPIIYSVNDSTLFVLRDNCVAEIARSDTAAVLDEARRAADAMRAKTHYVRTVSANIMLEVLDEICARERAK